MTKSLISFLLKGDLKREDLNYISKKKQTDEFLQLANPIWSLQEQGLEVNCVNFYRETKNAQLLAKFMGVLNEIDEDKKK